MHKIEQNYLCLASLSSRHPPLFVKYDYAPQIATEILEDLLTNTATAWRRNNFASDRVED